LLVKAQDIDGKTREFPAEEFFARVIQHELDHLEGILFIDHLSPLKRTLYKRRLKKLLRQQQEEG
jgi:peptide deformylase